jgi:hypothetical protein
MIGEQFPNPRRVVVLVEAQDGTQHGFEFDGGTVKWEWTGQADGPTWGNGSAGRVTVEGRFHRKNRPGYEQDELPMGAKEITDGQG